MTWLFFIDESGHGHRSTPYEVRGGFAIAADRLWSFIQDMQKLEMGCFGVRLHKYGKEIKGSKLLGKDKFEFAEQGDHLLDRDRQRLCRSLLGKGTSDPPIRNELTAYGQACLRMARETFALLKHHEAVLMAAAIPRGVTKPPNYQYNEYLRKDIVFLLERFSYFLENKGEHGILVMDETEKHQDRRFVARIESYFTKTGNGRYRATRIVPTPFFVSSDMTTAVQVADLCIYCINWGFRLPGRRMNAGRREEIASMFGRDLAHLQFRGQGYRDGRESYGIVYVPDPYERRTPT